MKKILKILSIIQIICLASNLHSQNIFGDQDFIQADEAYNNLANNQPIPGNKLEYIQTQLINNLQNIYNKFPNNLVLQSMIKNFTKDVSELQNKEVLWQIIKNEIQKDPNLMYVINLHGGNIDTLLKNNINIQIVPAEKELLPIIVYIIQHNKAILLQLLKAYGANLNITPHGKTLKEWAQGSHKFIQELLNQ